MEKGSKGRCQEFQWYCGLLDSVVLRFTELNTAICFIVHETFLGGILPMESEAIKLQASQTFLPYSVSMYASQNFFGFIYWLFSFYFSLIHVCIMQWLHFVDICACAQCISVLFSSLSLPKLLFLCLLILFPFEKDLSTYFPLSTIF